MNIKSNTPFIILFVIGWNHHQQQQGNGFEHLHFRVKSWWPFTDPSTKEVIYEVCRFMPTTRFASRGPSMARDIMRSKVTVGDNREESKADVPSPTLITKESSCDLGRSSKG